MKASSPRSYQVAGSVGALRMLIAILPVLLILCGLLVWFVSTNSKVAEIGRLAFACGLLELTWTLMRHTIHIG